MRPTIEARRGIAPLGGAPASDELIAKVVPVINENYKVEYIAQGDCTGEPEFEFEADHRAVGICGQQVLAVRTG